MGLILTWKFERDTIHTDTNIRWSFLKSIINQSRPFDEELLQLKIQEEKEVMQSLSLLAFDALLDKCSLKL